ncbi:MAG: AAA family ATPase, partial [Bacteroidota bacterium]|nr:AAA family ATPase [Bacteroidota bacterium]
MELIRRTIEERIKRQLGKNKVILIMGTRRVGKTVLVNLITRSYKGEILLLNAEDFEVQELLKNRSVSNYKRVLGKATLLVIDEAQVLPNIGQILKLMIDHITPLTIIATGSSSFDLANKTGEPLTGRMIPFNLYPLSQAEISTHENALETIQHLEERLIFGSYPETIHMNDNSEKSAYLLQLVQSYLLKDMLSFEGIRQSDKIISLLRLIAYQCGAAVSYHELSL